VTLRRKLVLISLLYFAEGFPYGIIEQALPVYFKIHGMSLVCLGLLSLTKLPYALKFIWAPAVDFIGKRRHWILTVQLLMACTILALLALDPSHPNLLLWVCIGALALFSATQDIAIDAYSIELLKTSEMGIANGFRQAAYRVALVLAGGIFVSLGGRIGWKFTYVIAASILVVCALISMGLPHVEIKRPAFSVSSLVAPLKDFVSRPGVVQVAMFILLYKLGELAMSPMIRSFWVDRGLTTDEIGLITGTLGVAASVAGALAGGLFIARYGIFNGLWFLGIWQAMSNLGYAWVAACPGCGNWTVYSASFLESFCAGLGTSAFLAFLMSVCKKEYSATQYAILSALFTIPGILCGTVSGVATIHIGYAWYFALTFVLSLPAFAFIFHARRWIPENVDCEELSPCVSAGLDSEPTN
jgi:MFS transporter, PAT family, beta-lactamase induction signal transducer AmpG